MIFSSELKYLYQPAIVLGMASVLALSGCRSLAPQYEQDERAAVAAVADSFGIGGGSEPVGAGHNKPSAFRLPQLTAEASQEDYLRFALLNHPRVRAAFYRWWAQAEAITPARSLPDPMLTFEADISNVVTSLMPGLMLEIPGWGKLEAMGMEAAAMSRMAYAQYVDTLFETAMQLREAWILLHYIDTALALRSQSAEVLGQSAQIAKVQYGTGTDGSLEVQSELTSAQHRLGVELASLRGEQRAARAAFKSALGLRLTDADPAWPQRPLALEPLPAPEALWQRLLEGNPSLGMLRAAVEAAVRSAAVAGKAGEPDFALGLMADVKMNPVMYRPQFAMSLPLWLDKIESLLVGANAQAHAAAADLQEGELRLAAELASMLYHMEEAGRRLDYVQAHEMPNLQRTRLSADAQYRVGDGDFASLTRLRLRELDVRMAAAVAQRDYDSAQVQIAYLVASPIPATGLFADAQH